MDLKPFPCLVSVGGFCMFPSSLFVYPFYQMLISVRQFHSAIFYQIIYVMFP